MPTAPPAWALPALTVAAATVLLTGTATAVVQRSDDEPARRDTATAPTAAPSPSPSPSAVPLDDLETRLAAAPLGFGRVDDAESGLGSLTVEQFVERAGLESDVRAQALASFAELDFTDARGHAWSADPFSIEFVVVRYGSPAQAARAFALTMSDSPDRFTSTTVPGAFTTRTEADGDTLLLGRFARGPFVYSVSSFALGAPADVEEFDRVLLRQRDLAEKSDPV